MSSYTLGIDTSNYATSLAVFNTAGEVVCAKKRFLPVKEGQLGLRQSDALFHHTVALPEMLKELGSEFDLTQISTEVIGKIARCAALEIEGVAEVSCGKQNRKVKDLLERANVQSPVTVEMRDGTAEITLEIVAAFGARIPAVAEKVQENVKSAVQNMTNVTVSRVDLVIAGLAPAAEPQA